MTLLSITVDTVDNCRFITVDTVELSILSIEPYLSIDLSIPIDTPLRSQMLNTHKFRVGPGARQMSNQGVKHCQANEGADNQAENGVQCAREEHRAQGQHLDVADHYGRP